MLELIIIITLIALIIMTIKFIIIINGIVHVLLMEFLYYRKLYFGNQLSGILMLMGMFYDNTCMVELGIFK